MIIQRMHNEVKLRYNKLNSNHKKDLPPALIDDILNEAQHIYIEIFYASNKEKAYRYGFEATQQRIDMLDTLVVKPEERYKPVKLKNDVYELELSRLEYPYKHLVRAKARTNCGIVNITPIKHDALNVILEDAMRGPSKRWRRLISAQGKSTKSDGSSIFIYSEPNFEIEDIISLEYIRRPRKVFFGGYNTLEFIHGDQSAYNENTEPVNSELPENYHTVLVDIAVQELSRILEDGERFQLRRDKILTTT